MTNEQLKQNAAAMLSFANGKTVQINYGKQVWYDIPLGEEPQWRFDTHNYRPKPEPVSRPWSKVEDVPGPVCWIRMPENTIRLEAMITAIYYTGCQTEQGCFGWEDIGRYEYSTDRKTWHKCEVTE